MNYSRQRDLIHNYLKSTKSHPTAEDVYQHVKEEIPNISLGTVYRNLGQLVDNNLAIKVHTDDGKDHFDAFTGEHYHFYCQKCKKVYDSEITIPESLKEAIVNKKELNINKVTGFSFLIQGMCNNCIKEGD
ncbi:MAG: transcriptional repressor [Erysipelotrichaceae bacterium]|nr:transcriptional repressor [Erysipelotrichaceae bacterium]